MYPFLSRNWTGPSRFKSRWGTFNAPFIPMLLSDMKVGSTVVHKQQGARQVRQYGGFVCTDCAHGASREGVYSRLYHSRRVGISWLTNTHLHIYTRVFEYLTCKNPPYQIHTSMHQPHCKIQDNHELFIRQRDEPGDVHGRLQSKDDMYIYMQYLNGAKGPI